MKAMGALLMSLALSACSAEDTPSTIDYSKLEVPFQRLASDDARALPFPPTSTAAPAGLVAFCCAPVTR